MLPIGFVNSNAPAAIIASLRSSFKANAEADYLVFSSVFAARGGKRDIDLSI